MISNLHLRAIRFNGASDEEKESFPFNIPAFHSFDELPLTSPVTFLVGENGSGKSTFLEALGMAVGANTIGSEDVKDDSTLTAVRSLANRLRLVWRARTHNGFFLRAEDFFGYIKRLSAMEAELLAELKRVDVEYLDRSEKAKGFARMPFVRELTALRKQYGRHLNTYSHGESFLELFQSRFQPNSLYLLDEPETPLSPMRQLTLISLMKQMVEQQCQFIIATHSPILMAYPGASILSFDFAPAMEVAYDELEHVTIMRSFLNDPETYLRHL
jgi:predicted ATPase